MVPLTQLKQALVNVKESSNILFGKWISTLDLTFREYRAVGLVWL